VNLLIQHTRPDAVTPWRAHSTDAGLDLAIPERVLISSVWTRVGVGVKVAIPPGYEGTVRPRSGTYRSYDCRLGTIDAGYRGELMVMLRATDEPCLWLDRGTRVAQLVVSPVSLATPKVVPALPPTERGGGGFGSTGETGAYRWTQLPLPNTD